MSTYVDQLVAIVSMDPHARRAGARHGHRWCHLLADSREELLAMAEAVGLRPEWLQVGADGFEHFDLTPPRRDRAVRLGAIEVTRRMAVAIRRRWRANRRIQSP